LTRQEVRHKPDTAMSKARSSLWVALCAIALFFGADLARAELKDDSLNVRFRCYYFTSATKYLTLEILVDLNDRPIYASSTAVNGDESTLPILIDLTSVDESRPDAKYYRGRGMSLRVESRRTPVSNIPYYYGQLKWRMLDPSVVYGMTCTT
jgi:hypothetical protein